MSLTTKSNGLDPFWSALDLNFFGDHWKTFARSDHFQITESADSFTITADMPGVREDDLDISVKNNVLAIRAERKDREYVYSKSYSLPAGADSSNIEASLDHGVLTVMIPKQPEAKPRRIQIKRRE